MSRLSKLTWTATRDAPLPDGRPGDELWVKLGWASFKWRWHEDGGVWAPDAWAPGAEMESAKPGAVRRDMSWARPGS